jgi:hypothetical protein
MAVTSVPGAEPPAPNDEAADLLGQLEAAVDAQAACSRRGDQEGLRRATETVNRILPQLESRREALTPQDAGRLQHLLDAQRVVCLATAAHKQEVSQRLRLLARGRSAAAVYGRR